MNNKIETICSSMNRIINFKDDYISFYKLCELLALKLAFMNENFVVKNIAKYLGIHEKTLIKKINSNYDLKNFYNENKSKYNSSELRIKINNKSKIYTIDELFNAHIEQIKKKHWFKEKTHKEKLDCIERHRKLWF